jgi:hypothetical protein
LRPKMAGVKLLATRALDLPPFRSRAWVACSLLECAPGSCAGSTTTPKAYPSGSDTAYNGDEWAIGAPSSARHRQDADRAGSNSISLLLHIRTPMTTMALVLARLYLV